MARKYKLANFPADSLNGAIDSSQTTLTLVDASEFPASGNFFIVAWVSSTANPSADSNAELMEVTGVAGNVLTVVRGQDGTSGVGHLSGAKVAMTLNVAVLEDLAQFVASSETINNTPDSGVAGFNFDDSIPQITEGDEFLSHTHTPEATTNILEIDVVFHWSNTALNAVGFALFKVGTNNALQAVRSKPFEADQPFTATFKHRMVAGTVSPIEFTVRAGSGGGTFHLNSRSGTRDFGGVVISGIYVKEFKA